MRRRKLPVIVFLFKTKLPSLLLCHFNLDELYQMGIPLQELPCICFTFSHERN